MTKIFTIGSILFRMAVHYENLVHYLVHQSHERTRKTAHIYEAKMQSVQHFADIGEKRQTPPVDSPTLKAARSNRVGRTTKKALISLKKSRLSFYAFAGLFLDWYTIWYTRGLFSPVFLVDEGGNLICETGVSFLVGMGVNVHRRADPAVPKAVAYVSHRCAVRQQE